ncbi:MAG: Homoserine kinase [Chlamydiales bacterium]|nr:Homoserine kinase [Chlamydiales bacterium]
MKYCLSVLICFLYSTALGQHVFPYGLDNQVCLVKTPYLRVEKRYTKKSLEEVLKITYFSEVYKKNGFPVPSMIGLGIVDSKPLLSMEYKEGTHPFHPTTGQLEAIGRLMARFHSQEIDRALLPSCVLIQEIDYFFRVSSSAPFLHDLKSSCVFDELEPSLSNVFSGPLHGDFSPTNLLMKGQNITALLDLDHTCYGAAIIDLARSFIFFCFDEKGKYNPQKQKALIKGYETVRKLSFEEKKLLNPLLNTLLIRMILETYYYTHVLKEVPLDLFTGYRATQSAEALYHRWKSCFLKQ